MVFTIILLSGCDSKKQSVIDKQCFTKPETGMCKAAIPKYFYNQKEDSCDVFIWGGCWGIVPFNSKNKYQELCVSK